MEYWVKIGNKLTFRENVGTQRHWTVCMLHNSELPLRHLIQQLEGPTTSKDGFIGPACKLISSVYQINANFDFAPLSGEEMISMPANVLANVSTDARSCYLLAKSVKEGELIDTRAGEH